MGVLFLAAKLETLRAAQRRRHKRPLASGQLPPAAGSAGRPLLAQRLPANQSGGLRARHRALHRPQPERLGHGFHAGRVFRRGQRVHHRAGHVLQTLRPRAAADDHRAGVGGPGGRAGRPPHRRRVQPDEGLRDLGQRQVRPGPPDLRLDRRHHQRLEPRTSIRPIRSSWWTTPPPASPPRTPGWTSPGTARGRMSCTRPISPRTAWRCSMASFKAIGSFTDPTVTSIEPSFGAWSVQTVNRQALRHLRLTQEYAWRRGGRVQYRRPTC